MVSEFRDRHLKRKKQWLALLSELQPNNTRRHSQIDPRQRDSAATAK